MPDAEAIAFLERLAGDEIDLVPTVLEAAETGGAAWQDLVRPAPSAMLGGVAEVGDPGLLALAVELLQTSWPAIAGAVREAAQVLSGELGGLVKDGAVTGAAAVTILRWLRERRSTELPAAAREGLARGLDDMRRHLVALGLDAARAQAIAQDVLAAACADPGGAGAVAGIRRGRR